MSVVIEVSSTVVAYRWKRPFELVKPSLSGIGKGAQSPKTMWRLDQAKLLSYIAAFALDREFLSLLYSPSNLI